MSKKLVVVESPTKAKAIQRYLGSEFDVKASMGHVMDLPKKGGGYKVESVNGGYRFEPELVPIKSKAKTIRELKTAAKKSTEVFLAPDPDREGEAIAYHIATLIDHKRIHRVLFHEITKKAVQEAFRHPKEIDSNLVNAQQSRRLLDRIVGFDVSQLLWEKIARGLSAGRVQTVALRLLVEREKEIRRFRSVEYWTLNALFRKGATAFSARLFSFDNTLIVTPNESVARKILKFLDSSGGKPITEPFPVKKGSAVLLNRASVEKIVEKIKTLPPKVTKVTRSERKRSAPPPFITSTLQQEAAAKLRFPVSQTMRVAQQLYEGIELGPDGMTGLITYMRTDSVRVSDDAVGEARRLIEQCFGKQYLPEKPNRYRNKKGAQDAHEAIRPSSALRDPESVRPYLDRKQYQLYRLIWSRFIASQCRPAVFDTVSVDISLGPALFRATGSVLKFPGFLKVYQTAEKESESETNQRLPELEEGDRLETKRFEPAQHKTQPPPRYSEATLVKELEKRGIGRPSTYASIIATLKNRKYTHVVQRRLVPTDLGIAVTDMLIRAFPEIFDYNFTAEMENELDAIEEGEIDWQKVLSDFYGRFRHVFQAAQETMPNLKAGVDTEFTCPKCGSPMRLRYGKNGRFLACSAFDTNQCSTTFEVTEDAEGNLRKIETPEFDEVCPKCHSPMLFKKSRFGAFLACSRYPECRGTRSLKKVGEEQYEVEKVEIVDRECPECGGEMEVKKSRFGRFLACTRYPDCKGALPYFVNVPCPAPGCSGELCERRGKSGLYYTCSQYPQCRFRSSLEPVAQTCPECSAPALFRKDGSLVCARKDCSGVLPDTVSIAESET
ncbi:MAG: type I DNA topoisomerase [Candidatus Hydrogenedentota bacterium]|nr:MAG: type I DNA topoisomerase [Candidatus Hydrogenedentota bacterium]